ncbi:hypothetical protein NDU88_009210 [Pleurodeles waltl]|uniref:Uncharacterized protein n=1 Tax=Pleurodeles waltl TaxID=8319 RepID=A0AAV7QS04_PLEWA|nr:hypothetical protein NDU88_009210 [Pleurodeles waltl]
MKHGRRHRTAIEADPQRTNEFEESKVCTPGEHKQGQGGCGSTRGQGIDKYFTPLGNNVCRKPLSGEIFPRPQPNGRSFSDSAITLGTSWETAPPSKTAQESMPDLSSPSAVNTQPSHVTQDNSLVHTIKPQKWEPPVSPIIVIKGRRGAGTPRNHTPNENSTDGNQEKPGPASPGPASAKHLTSPCWEATLTKEELEEVFNKEEEQCTEEGGEDTLLAHTEKRVKHSSTIGEQALETPQNHNHSRTDTKDALRTGWEALNSTLMSITNAMIFNTDKLDIQIEILQNLATTTMAIDNKLDKLNALIRRAQSHMKADKGKVNQTYQCHCSSILDKLQELPTVKSTLVTDLKQELLQRGNVKQLLQSPQGTNNPQKRTYTHPNQDAASPEQALGSSVKDSNQEHTAPNAPIIPVLSRKNKKRLRMHNKTVMESERKYLHPSSHGNRSSPGGNPRANQKQHTAAQLGDTKSPSTTVQRPPPQPRNKSIRLQEEGKQDKSHTRSWGH